ncbi:MAG TPA: hypothetical protein VFG69_12975 [Nannocystaceae bacterium]|nr:hypothetical protein [Nannocystaceae bacterium]
MNALRLVLTPTLALLLACSSDDADGNDDGNDDNATGASAGETADSSGGGDDSALLECAADIPEDAMDGTMPGIMGTWGAACDVDADCVTLLGDGAICLKAAVIFELPLGYCSKPCDLPMGFSGSVPDDPTCDAEGGVACLGVDGMFEYCTVACTDNAQCERTGYYCRQMPVISAEGDPSYCLMPDCCDDNDCSL